MKINKNKPINFIPALTGYRAIAAWIIFVYHFFPFKNVDHKYPKFLANTIWEFHIGVDMFFVLSGFLITYRYFFQEKISFKEYMVNRFARIYPMYFIMTLLVFVIMYINIDVWTVYNTLEAFVSFTMTKALFKEFFLSGVSQGWTLTLEEIFYLFAPFYFILIKRSRYFLVIIPFVVFFLFSFIKSHLNVEGNIYGFLQKNIYSYIIEFFVGIGVAILVLKDKIKRKGFYTYFGIIFFTLFLVCRQYLITPLNLKNEFNHFIEMFVFCAFGIAPIIIGLIYEKTFIQRFLSLKLMVILGKSSYIFYLIHKGFIPIFIDEHLTSNKLLLFILLNIISYFMFKYIEEPLNHYIRKRYKALKASK